jgi:hypothetical protein
MFLVRLFDIWISGGSVSVLQGSFCGHTEWGRPIGLGGAGRHASSGGGCTWMSMGHMGSRAAPVSVQMQPQCLCEFLVGGATQGRATQSLARTKGGWQGHLFASWDWLWGNFSLYFFFAICKVVDEHYYLEVQNMHTHTHTRVHTHVHTHTHTHTHHTHTQCSCLLLKRHAYQGLLLEAGSLPFFQSFMGCSQKLTFCISVQNLEKTCFTCQLDSCL